METTLRAGLGLLKPPSPTFVTLRHSSTLDLAFTTPGIRYECRKPADTWGSDHFPLFLTPTSRRPQEDRTYAVISWPEFRVRSKEIPPGQSFLDHVATCAREATTLVRVPASSPVPDLRLLNIRANRRRQERIALNTSLPADWTAYRRIDAACRRHARRRRRQSWTGVCSSIQRCSHSGKAWRLLKALVHPQIPRRPILAIAIARAISIEDLAELMADQFIPPGGPVSSPPPALPTPRTPAAPPGVLAHVVAQCYAAITAHELQAVLDRPRKRTAPGADGISHQMLRNLDTPERTRLLEAFNAIWGSATLPEDWLTAVVVPVLKPRKPSRLPSSYRPVSLTSAACKTMEAIALFRLTWIARVTNFLPEQLTGFRRGRCTADSIADLVSTLEDARHDGDAVMLVLLDVKAAFDTLPHSVIHEALSRLGVTGPLLAFIQAFLQGRTFRAPFPPPPTRPPLPISVDIRSCSRRRTPVAALQQTAATLLQESLGGHLQVYTDGSVLPATGQAAAACVAPALGAALSCHLRFPANSTAAELAGLHLAADLLLLLPGQQPAVILTDSRAALQLLRQHQPIQHTVGDLKARLMAIQDAGRPVSLQWLPSHVGITGNEAADQLAGAAHTNGSPVSSKVTQLDFARPALRQAVRALHPDPRVASGVRFMRVPDCLPRRERALILRLRTGCSWTQARLHRHGRAPSPACSFCGADETLGHLLCACPNLEAARRDMTAGYRNLGLPSYSDQDLLHPKRSQTDAFRLLLEFLQSTGLASRL
ncbi:hypothetical protein V5799_017149 [Amblyomma americanum]|uniref:RNase H type-1 domain-containing protein n=1 Tax=Amblyomma americanum TaxID=6943 RepID=A0AAQ4F2X6_AMBAM